MSNIVNGVTNIFISDGTALPANNTAITSLTAGKIGFYSVDSLMMDPSGVDTITTTDYFNVVGLNSASEYKRSMKVPGVSTIRYEGIKYTPSARCVWTIGYNRKTAVGTINSQNSTDYSFSIEILSDKLVYSERPERFLFNFTSAASATQLTIATQIAGLINARPKCKDLISAKVIGNGTGVSGLTGATAWGVETMGLTQTQLVGSYLNDFVNYQVNVDDSTGFDTSTTCTQIQVYIAGSGTYVNVYNIENFCYGFEGVVNRRQYPIPTLTYSSSSSTTLSGTVAGCATTPTGNITVVISEDVAVVATATTGLRPGELITINAVAYEIKYILDATHFVVTAPFSASYGAGAELKVKYLYDMYNVTFSNPLVTQGPGVINDNIQQFIIAVPAIDAGAADPFDVTGDSADMSAGGIQIKAILNTYMNSTPKAFANIAL